VVNWRVVKTGVWDYVPPEQATAERTLASQQGHVFMPRTSTIASGRTLGLLMGAGALLLSFFLAAALVALNRQNDRLEQVALVLAQEALRDSNALACPDPQLRLIVPLIGTTLPSGSDVELIGTANYPAATRYQMDFRPTGTEQWNLIGRSRRDQQLGELGRWDTTSLTPGLYDVRLAAVDGNNIRLAGSPLCIIQLNITP
jgi:hypothetical protein